MATKFLDYTGLSYLWGKIKAWCNATFVHLTTDENITGTKTFVGSKKIAFKQSTANDKLGFTLYNNSSKEQGYLEYNPTNKIANVPLFTLGNYATAADELTYIGFRRYSNISGASGAYNLLAPLISDAKTPFNLTTTYTNFYLPLGISDGTSIVKASNSGIVDISSLLTLTGYTKASADSALATTDTIKQALGKLEYKIDNVAENIGDTTPVGTILYFATDTAPEGFLVCDGTAVSRSLYSDLFDVIGTTYGSGDGSTTFNLPNLVNKFAEGAVTNIGDNVSAGLPNITGVLTYAGSFGSSDMYPSSGVFNWELKNTTATQMKEGSTDGTHDIRFDASRSNSIYGNSNTVQPPAVKLLPCIKAISTNSSNEEATVESLIEGFKEEIEEKFEQLAPKDPLPIGSIVHFASGTVPVGYLVCDGSAVSRTTYSALFDVIGTTYGSGDGSTTFNVPNLIGRFLEGANTGVGTSVNAGLPNITGKFSSLVPQSHSKVRTGAFTGSDFGSASAYENVAAPVAASYDSNGILWGYTLDSSLSSSVYGNSNTVQPNSVKLLPCIKASYTSLADANAVANFQTIVSNIDGNLVHKIGNEIINGVKTFNESVWIKNGIELQPASGSNHGGYIDFHFNGSSADFTSRIWEPYNRQIVIDCDSIQTRGSYFSKYSGITKGSNPSGSVYWTWGATDQNGINWADNCIGQFETELNAEGTVLTRMRAMRNVAGSGDCVQVQAVCYSSNYGHIYGNRTLVLEDSTTYNQIRLIAGSYGLIFRNDGADFYLLPTAANDSWGGWTSARPLTINLASGICDINGKAVRDGAGNVITDTYVTLGTEQNVGGYKRFWKDISFYWFGYNLETGNITEDRWWSLIFHTGDGPVVGGIWKCLRASDNNSYISLRSYRFNGDGSYAAFHVAKQADGVGYCNLTNVSNVRPQSNGAATLGLSGTRWGVLYTTSNVSVSSDERIKTQIENIPELLLDAWENLNYKQFKMIDSIEEKGDKARLHTGNIAQDVDRIFKDAGLEARDYGFFCWDEWEAKEASYDEEGQLVDSAQEAGDLYSLRYGELLCIEAAYQRRKNKILENRISELEKQVSDMLQILQSLKGAN